MLKRVIFINNQKLDDLILHAIQTTNLPVGATFLSARLGVPQTTIGRRLNDLERQNLLYRMSNKGRQLTAQGIEYLQQNKRTNTIGRFINIVDSTAKERLLEILEIRKSLETLAIEGMCRNGTDDQLAELRTICDDYSRAIEHGLSGNEEGLELHLAISRMSGNKVLHQLMKILLTDKNGYAKLVESPDRRYRDEAAEHAEIANAIIARDTERAVRLMNEHLDYLIHFINTAAPAGADG